jgi:hypothetical protein
MDKQYALRVGITLPTDGITLNLVVMGETDVTFPFFLKYETWVKKMSY